MRGRAHPSAPGAVVVALLLVVTGVAPGGCDDQASTQTVPPRTVSVPARDPEAAVDPAPTPETAPAPDARRAATKADHDATTDGHAPDLGGGVATAVTAEAGPAYFAVRDRGVVRLQDGAFTLVQGAPDILLRDMQLAEDGRLYLLASKGVYRIEDAQATVVAETPFRITGSVDAFTVGRDGTIWAVGYKGVSRWDGKAWTTEDKARLGADVTLLEGVAVDGTGRVWLASASALHTLEGSTWTRVDVAKLFARGPFFKALRRAPDGTAYALASDALVRAESPADLETVDLGVDGFASMDSLAFAEDGTLALRSRVDAVLVRTPAGVTRQWTLGKDFGGDAIRTVGVDAGGRVWVGTDVGVSVLGPGDEKAEWASGSVLELAGQVEHIVPLGAGPTLPVVGAPKTAGLRGRIYVDGKPLVGANVELCPSPDMTFRISPCGDATVHAEGSTNIDGEFSIADLPIGAYGIAVEVEGKWQLTMSSNFGAKMKQGEIHDVGTINVKARAAAQDETPAAE